MIIYILMGEREGLPECFDAITQAQEGDDEETVAYMKERKSQIRQVVDKKEVPVLMWVPIELDYGKLLKNFTHKPPTKGKIYQIEGEEHARIYRGNGQNGEVDSR